MQARLIKMKKTAKFSIEGMKCKSCAEIIRDSLEELPGVSSAKIDFTAKKAAIIFDPAAIKEKDIAERVKSKGYNVK